MSDKRIWKVGGQKIEQNRRIIDLENELKAMRHRLAQILYYVDAEELRSIGRVAKLTPTMSKLRVLAAENPPPADWRCPGW